MSKTESSERKNVSGPVLNGRLWTAGARYANGVEIWCAFSSGVAAWTMDRGLAAKFSSESDAAMAAQQLTEGTAVPFWLESDGQPDA